MNKMCNGISREVKKKFANSWQKTTENIMLTVKTVKQQIYRHHKKKEEHHECDNVLFYIFLFI